MPIFDFAKKKEREPKNMEEVLTQFKELKEDFKKISGELESLKRDNKFNVQKVGLVRFNPFKEIGGNQSFSLALLDGKQNGVVVTSLYTREGNRVYGKPIENGKSLYLLSQEENQAIERAQKIETI